MTARCGKPARRYDPSRDRAAAIRRARDWAHMSERDLAAAVGVSQATVRAWEAAVRDPGPDMAWRIAVATRVAVSSLLMPSCVRSVAPAMREAAA